MQQAGKDSQGALALMALKVLAAAWKSAARARDFHVWRSVAEKIAERFSSIPASEMGLALEEASRALGKGVVAASALGLSGMDAKQAKAAVAWAKSALIDPGELAGFESALLSTMCPHLGAHPLPGIYGIEDASGCRPWAHAQALFPSPASQAIFEAGLGLARASERDGFHACKGANLQERESKARMLLGRWLQAGWLDGSMHGCGFYGLLQSICRKAADAEIVALALAAQARAGFEQGESYQGQHPLWVACQSERGGYFHASAEAAMRSIMELGFGPNMELPFGISIQLSATQSKNNAPSMPLEWAKRSVGGVDKAAALAHRFGVDLDARNAGGDTLLGVLNRWAKRPNGSDFEKQFIQVATLGADPLKLASEKNPLKLAATEHARRAAEVAQEGRALAMAMDESVLTRARQLMEQRKADMQAQREKEAPPKRRL